MCRKRMILGWVCGVGEGRCFSGEVDLLYWREGREGGGMADEDRGGGVELCKRGEGVWGGDSRADAGEVVREYWEVGWEVGGWCFGWGGSEECEGVGAGRVEEGFEGEGGWRGNAKRGE